MKKRIILAVMLLALLAAMPLTVSAEVVAPEPVEIYTVEDLQAIADDPAGSYILMADVDMADVSWKSVDFSGTFDGNGYAILNLTLSAPSAEKALTYDGNYKSYENVCVGLFGTLRDAKVTNLNLINVRGVVESDAPCLVGGIAGYADNSTISGCTITGCLELRAHHKMFGIGGVVGFGSGKVENCRVDMTLICVDTDAATRDEQFLGGVLAAGYMDILDCDVTIDGYVSERGYAHNGGIVGMCIRNPAGDRTDGRITGNTVTGKITFFEENYDRRAYCEPIVGEMMTAYCTVSDNTEQFQRDERFEYDTELRPEMCAEPIYMEATVDAGCDTYGYMHYTCTICGYMYTDHYTSFAHVPATWTVVEEPTTEKEGLSVGYCACGQEEFQQVEEMLPTEPTEATEPPATTQPATEPVMTEPQPTEPAPEPEKDGNSLVVILVVAAAAVVIIVAVILILRKRRKPGKFQRGRK